MKLFAEGMLFETIAVALDVYHPGVVKEPIKDGRGDLPDAATVAIKCNYVHKYLLGDHRQHLLSREAMLPSVHPPGDTLFIPIFGTLLHSR